MKVALKNYKSTHVHILIDTWGGKSTGHYTLNDEQQSSADTVTRTWTTEDFHFLGDRVLQFFIVRSLYKFYNQKKMFLK